MAEEPNVQQTRVRETQKSQNFSGNNFPVLVVEGNLASNWKNWYQRFKIYMRATNLENEDDKRKVAIFLHYIGSDALKIFSSFNEDMDQCKYNDLIAKFEDYCRPRTNITVERHNFLTRSQKPDETIDEFVTALKNLSLTCDLDVLRESLVKDMFIAGLSVNNRQIKERLLQEDNLDLEKAVKISKSIELTQVQAEQLYKGSEVMVKKVHQSSYGHAGGNGSSSKKFVKKQDNSSYYGQKLKSCKFCGQKHEFKPNICPGRDVICRNCNSKGHFAKFCSKKNVRFVNVDVEKKVDNSAGEEFFVIHSIENSNNLTKNKLWTLDIMVNNQTVNCFLDTGAEANILSYNEMCRLGIISKLIAVDVKLISFSKNVIPVIGKIIVKCIIQGKVAYLAFLVVKIDCQTIIGQNAINVLGLIKRINEVQQVNVEDQFKDLFDGLGRIPTKCHITVDKNITPVVHQARKIPFALMERFKEEINRMVNLKIIEEVTKPTEWVNTLVVVEKKDKSLRVCLDPRSLNRAIKRSHYQLPTIENVRSSLSNAKYFSTLDAQCGFWQIELDDSSSDLCVFATPFGRFKFLRMPFGISCAPEIFHKIMSDIFVGIEGVMIYLDDILVYSDTMEKHNEILKKVFNKAKEANLQFNSKKCHFRLTEIQYMGHNFGDKGMSPDQKKIEAIIKLPEPKNVKELKRFLGMVNYLGSFIENLSAKTTNLRQLLKKNNHFSWENNHQQEFNDLKNCISQSPVLAYYDSKIPLTLSVDASKFAVGAVILQNKRPIAYASRSMTQCQTNYAQIEKELYAIQFGCTKFRQYVYGNTVTVETDHQPLVTLFKRPLSEVPTRLQRMMLSLQQYDLNVTYVAGKYLFIADTLSRAPVDPPEEGPTDENAIRIHMNLFFDNLAVTPKRMTEIKSATEADEEMQVLIKYCNDGWPNSKNSVNNSVKCYYNCRHEIHTINGLVFKGNLLIIPKSLRSEILEVIHEGHMGIERCLKQARSVIYWPNITVHIKNKVEQCLVCLKFRSNNSKEPLLPHEIVQLPWHKVAIDYFYYNKITYLLIVDYFSNYFEVTSVKTTNTEEAVSNLKAIFSRHGIPKILMSDNGPPFNGKEFNEFLTSWDIEHITSSPNYPKSNGLVERTVRTVKKIFEKSKESNTDPYIALLQHRNTPQSSGYSPSELLMSRTLRTKLPISEQALKPKVIDYEEYGQFLKEKERKVKDYHDQHSKPLSDLEKGDNVMFKKSVAEPWEPATIEEIGPSPRSYYVKTPDGKEYRRNRQHLIKRKEPTPLPNVPIKNQSTHQENLVVPESGRRFSSYGREIKKPQRLISE